MNENVSNLIEHYLSSFFRRLHLFCDMWGVPNDLGYCRGIYGYLICKTESPVNRFLLRNLSVTNVQVLDLHVWSPCGNLDVKNLGENTELKNETSVSGQIAGSPVFFNKMSMFLRKIQNYLQKWKKLTDF